MASEINTKDQLAAMLSAKLNEFLDGVSDSYGKVILDELVARLEYTVADFKDEETTNGEASTGSTGEGDREISEWEKKLEQLG